MTAPNAPEERLSADYECHTCARRFTSANPWDCMVPGGRVYGPFCSRTCLDAWSARYDGPGGEE